MKITRALIAVIVTLLCTTCANRIYQEFPKPFHGESGKVYIYRTGTVSSGGAIPIKLDGKIIADLEFNYKLELNLKPGLHVFDAFPVFIESDRVYYVCFDDNNGVALKSRVEAVEVVSKRKLLADNSLKR